MLMATLSLNFVNPLSFQGYDDVKGIANKTMFSAIDSSPVQRYAAYQAGPLKGWVLAANPTFTKSEAIDGKSKIVEAIISLSNLD